jgi:ribosomal protein S18 acetylase RimI-like enzyme
VTDLNVGYGVDVSVRRAQVADLESMLPIWQETVETLVRADPRYTLAADAAIRWQSAVTDWLSRTDTVVFIAERKGAGSKTHVIGYMVGVIVPSAPGLVPEHYGCITELAIESHGKGGGIGRSLLEALREWFHQQGITRIEARVPSRNPIAQAFWRALGATELFEQMYIK